MTAKAIALVTEHIGSDLSRIVNEIEKVTVNLAGRKSITEDDVEKYIGVSKEYNAFELQEALSKKNLVKAVKIIQYFEGNSKAGPIQLILPALYGYFSKLYVAFGMADKSENAIKVLFSNNSFAAKDALIAMKRYNYEGVERCLLLLHEYNLKSIGINSGDASHTAMLKELVVKMMG
jgi:DNA polymerase-3 subunit delta